MDTNNFSSRDLTLSATLLTLGIELECVEYQLEGSKVVGYFVFKKSPLLEEIIKKYWSKQLAVEPQAFQASVRALKSQLNSMTKSPRSEFNKEQ